jgi:U3 small nucleolar RNA-associated protein 20
LLGKFCDLFFLALGTRLVNDESSECRKKIAESIELLIKHVSSDSREQMFNIIAMLLKEKNDLHKEMAAQLTIRFCKSGEIEFLTPKLPTLLKLLSNSITEYFNSNEPGRFVRIKKLKTENAYVNSGEDSNRDHLLIQSLIAANSLMEYNDANLFKNDYNLGAIHEIGIEAKSFLSHDHTWVRIYALKILNMIISNTNFERIEKCLINEDDASTITNDFFLIRNKSAFQSLVFDVLVQLKPDVDAELLKVINEFLLIVAKVIKNIPFNAIVNDKKDFNLMWLIRRLRYAIHSEIATTPSLCIVRKSVFNFFINLLNISGHEVIVKLSNSILKVVLREITDGEHVIDELKQIGIVVCNNLKLIIGKEFEKIQSAFQLQTLYKRVNRRKVLAQEKIKNPEKAAFRAISKQLKKQNRKRKINDNLGLQKKRKINYHEMN